MGKLYEELKRRKVFRVAAVYAVVAWVLIQVTDVVLPTFGAPSWVNQTIIFLFILGFLPTLIAAWAYEITPEGVRADAGVQSSSATTNSIDRKLIYATFALVLLVAGFQVTDRFLLDLRAGNAQIGAASIGPSTVQTFRANIALGESQINTEIGMHGDIAISPDGRRIAYINFRGNDASTASILNLETARTQVIAASSSGQNPMSPVYGRKRG